MEGVEDLEDQENLVEMEGFKDLEEQENLVEIEGLEDLEDQENLVEIEGFEDLEDQENLVEMEDLEDLEDPKDLVEMLKGSKCKLFETNRCRYVLNINPSNWESPHDVESTPLYNITDWILLSCNCFCHNAF